ncbi:hypothetical protein [Nonomuraea rhizosphaerae]|uniref:hypothetical protein n=1 Tax=Nonomuraea rhizosphaerae TaxID=2665663 RepID=UPI001C604B04|nr:hypothetical protein [Nonomuraea rhizosphaerae]
MTATLTASVADVLHKTALYVNHPVNASLADALDTATHGDTVLEQQAADALALVLRRRTCDLGWWDRSHTRAQVAARLADAALLIERDTAPVTRLCEMAGCSRRDATERSACGIFYICPPCWEQVEQLTAIYQAEDAEGGV